MTYFEAACDRSMKSKSSQMRQYADVWYRRPAQSRNIGLSMVEDEVALMSKPIALFRII